MSTELNTAQTELLRISDALDVARQRWLQALSQSDELAGVDADVLAAGLVLDAESCHRAVRELTRRRDAAQLQVNALRQVERELRTQPAIDVHLQALRDPHVSAA